MFAQRLLANSKLCWQQHMRPWHSPGYMPLCTFQRTDLQVILMTYLTRKVNINYNINTDDI